MNDDGTVAGPAAVAARALYDRVADSPQLKAAARIAATFHLDPVVVAGERDPFLRMFRLAAHNRVVADHNAAQKG